MIKAENIVKKFGELEVLKNVSLSIAEKEIVSIVGASGAGKTTLLQILGTLEKSSEPKKYNTSIQIAGQDITKLNDRDLSKFRNENIGFIFQFHQLLPEFNAIENICIPAFIKKTKKAEAEKRAKELMSYLGLSQRLTHKPNQLSGGEQQRVAIARALLNDPEIILADEPTGNLDPQTSVEVMNVLKKINESGRTIIMATHDYALIMKFPSKTLKCEENTIFEVIQKSV